MKKLYSLVLSFLLYQAAWAQDASSDKDKALLQEGTCLYQSEMASWHGSDLFMAQLKTKANLLGGYLSYPDGDKVKCIFFTREEQPSVIAQASFEPTFDLKQATLEEQARPFNAREQELFTIRKAALARINSDTLFKSYSNANLNLIPLIEQEERKVYVLTGPTTQGVVLFGNDYLLTFDKTNKISAIKQLHKSLIPIQTSPTVKDGKAEPAIASMHTHLPETGDHFTATDICTLLLYQKFTTWKHHYVVTPKNVSVWNCETNQLTTLTKEAWEKINQHQQQLRDKRK
ncbi:hypothetical protein [Rufibacter immobilis]|uniref:hypothetical protein n=1 Tax=Rufibacter immobilis TaxID=1348778 RepID=UPI0035F02386